MLVFDKMGTLPFYTNPVCAVRIYTPPTFNCTKCPWISMSVYDSLPDRQSLTWLPRTHPNIVNASNFMNIFLHLNYMTLSHPVTSQCICAIKHLFLSKAGHITCILFNSLTSHTVPSVHKKSSVLNKYLRNNLVWQARQHNLHLTFLKEIHANIWNWQQKYTTWSNTFASRFTGNMPTADWYIRTIHFLIHMPRPDYWKWAHKKKKLL